MSTTGEAGRLSSEPGPASSVSLDVVIDAAKRLDELSTARVICEAAEAVHKAQKGGQPVGSVSPKMILVNQEGIALDLMAAGSPAYSSPERLEGKPGDRRSDVFSLGIVLWEALAHERLFEDGGDVMAKDIPSVSELNANVPTELDAIVKKALSREPAERFPSAKVFAAELSTLLDDAGYPDSHEEIAKYLAATFPAGAKLVSTPASSGPMPKQGKAPLNQTVLGMAPIREADLAAAKAVADKAAADKAAADKAAADKAAADKKAAEEKAAAEKKAAADKKAAEEKAAAEKKAVADKKAAEERAAAEKKAAADKAVADKKAAEEKAAADRKAAADKRAAEEKAAADK
ncbi:MAG: hypothetical protein JNL83_30525, partial [Myxococcales bacterium]|nr:hypothetical protein [Myxococcales bacterium]